MSFVYDNKKGSLDLLSRNDAVLDLDVADPERVSLAVAASLDGGEALASGGGSSSIDPLDRVLVAAEELVLAKVLLLASVAYEGAPSGLSAEFAGVPVAVDLSSGDVERGSVGLLAAFDSIVRDLVARVEGSLCGPSHCQTRPGLAIAKAEHTHSTPMLT